MKRVLILATVLILSATLNAKTVVNGVNGNWGPQHNTRNFRYVVVKSDKDYFKHKRNNRTVGTKCKRGKGRYVIDYYKNGRDACVLKTFAKPYIINKPMTSGVIHQNVGKCYKYTYKNREPIYRYSGVHGNWGPQHNTRNFRFVIVQGDKDYFKHKRRNRTVGTKCRRGEGTYINDVYSDGRDACRKQVGYKSCPTGYVPKAGKCAKKIASANKIKRTIKRAVHGNWGPQHNTRNFRYVVVKGDKDYYKHKRGNRTVGTKCRRGEGTYVIDAYPNGRDACVITKWVCPTGYQN